MGGKNKRKRNRGGRKKTDKEVMDKSAQGGSSDKVGSVRTYFKVLATFKCSAENCNKSWNSAHAWETEDDENGINCEVCQVPAELVDAKDETLELDTYICPNPKCDGNMWQSIHSELNKTIAQECDLCNGYVLPEGAPQKRFGRHYYLRCLNMECPEKAHGESERESFSLEPPKTQRCTKCYSAGHMIKISKVYDPKPFEFIKF